MLHKREDPCLTIAVMSFSKQVDLKIILKNLIMGNFGRKLYKEPNVSNFYGFYMNKRNFTTLK